MVILLLEKTMSIFFVFGLFFLSIPMFVDFRLSFAFKTHRPITYHQLLCGSRIHMVKHGFVFEKKTLSRDVESVEMSRSRLYRVMPSTISWAWLKTCITSWLIFLKLNYHEPLGSDVRNDFTHEIWLATHVMQILCHCPF